MVCAAGLYGCRESASVTAPSDGDPPSFDGATIDRTLQLIAVWASGPPNNLALAVGYEDTESLCTGQGFIGSPERGQAVLTPATTLQLHTFTKQAFAEVFDFAGTGGIGGTDFCDVFGAPVLASGTVTYTQVVHDPGSTPGAVAVHLTVTGIVDLSAGGQARLHATALFVVRPNGSVLDKTEISLRPLS
jgi:hypothetical protein